MKRIQYFKTLFYYDGPQVFEARDAIGGHYVAVMAQSETTCDKYLVAGVPPEKLRDFRSGLLDLKSMLIEAGKDDWYLTTLTDNLYKPLEIIRQNSSISESELLPADGFLLHKYPADTFVVKEAQQRNNLVLTISAEPPESAIDHRIRSNTLAEMLMLIQKMISHAYKLVTREDPSRYRDLANHMMDVVVPASAGSFRVIFEASKGPDLLGNSELSYALGQVDAFFENTANPDKTLITLKEKRGHFAGTYLKLLKFLSKHEMGLWYSWAEPSFAHARQGSVMEGETRPLIDVLSTVTNLGSESVTLEGTLESFNRATNSWGLRTEKGKKNGRIKEGGPSLDGLAVGGSYIFYCEDEIEEVDLTGREVHRLYLARHKPAVN